MKIKKKELEKLYYKSTSSKVATYYGISRTRVYFYLNKFNIPLKNTLTKTEQWMNKINLPETEKEYKNFWKDYRPRPLDKWYTSEDVENKYLIRKTYKITSPPSQGGVGFSR